MEGNMAVSESQEEVRTEKYLSFFINNQRYGIPISLVIELIAMQKVAEVPEFPYYAKGIINLRGLIVPLIDVRLRIGYPEAPYTDKTCIIVATCEGIDIGLIVDEVDEVLDIPSDEINPPTRSTDEAVERYVNGVAVMPDKLTLLMSCEKLIGEGYLDY